jgi:uncharacterized protein YjiK
MPRARSLRAALRALALAAAIAACGAPSPAVSAARDASLFGATPSGAAPLPAALAEVSGLAVTADGRVLSHDDEWAVVRVLAPATGEIVKSFAVGEELGDFEGIAVAGADIYLVTSAGRLLRFREGAEGAHVPFEAYDTGLARVCEVEGLAYNKATDSLVLACKTMMDRAMRDTVALYAWSVRTQRREPAPWRALKMSDLARAAGVEEFHPSSVEIDPASGRLILLAGRESALVELAADGRVLVGRHLDRRHNQPEGAAILRDGSLLIADEGKKRTNAQLTRYPRTP